MTLLGSLRHARLAPGINRALRRAVVCRHAPPEPRDRPAAHRTRGPPPGPSCASWSRADAGSDWVGLSIGQRALCLAATRRAARTRLLPGASPPAIATWPVVASAGSPIALLASAACTGSPRGAPWILRPCCCAGPRSGRTATRRTAPAPVARQPSCRPNMKVSARRGTTTRCGIAPARARHALPSCQPGDRDAR